MHPPAIVSSHIPQGESHRRGRKSRLAASHPHPKIMQRVCIAIDWGTAACGYALATPSPTSTSPVNARILPFKPGDRASQATEKNLTAILLDAGTLNIVAFGREARRRFFDMDQAEQKNYAFIQQCKMALSGGTAPLHDRTVHAEGADIAVPLLTAIAKMLEFIRLEAIDRVRSIGLDVNSIAWVLTVPAIWTDEGKYFMRQAAFQAGLISELESDRLALALEPEGAVISSAMDAPPEVRAQLKVGQRVMVLDCGGGTVDCTVSEIQSNDPPRLKEILAPTGGSWGGSYVDAEFRKFVNDVILSTSPSAAVAAAASTVSTASDPETASPGGESASETTGTPSTSTTRHADATATASAMDAWESAKCGWDPTDPAHDKVIVSGLASVCEHVGGADELSARVAAYNASRGLEGSAGVVYRPRSFSLVLPPAVVKGFFDACVEPICGHLQGLLVAAAEKRKPVAFVFLVGGFAESVYLQRSVREALLTDEGTLAAALIVPAKPVQCVNRGAAVWGLYPSSFITSRVAKMTIAVSLCERYNPALHNPLPHPSYLITNSTGQWVDNVLVPLIQLNEDIPVDHVSGQEGELLCRVCVCAFSRVP